MSNNGQRYCYQGIVLDPLIQIKGFTCLSSGSQGQVFTLSALFIWYSSVSTSLYQEAMSEFF